MLLFPFATRHICDSPDWKVPGPGTRILGATEPAMMGRMVHRMGGSGVRGTVPFLLGTGTMRGSRREPQRRILIARICGIVGWTIPGLPWFSLFITSILPILGSSSASCSFHLHLLSFLLSRSIAIFLSLSAANISLRGSLASSAIAFISLSTPLLPSCPRNMGNYLSASWDSTMPCCSSRLRSDTLFDIQIALALLLAWGARLDSGEGPFEGRERSGRYQGILLIQAGGVIGGGPDMGRLCAWWAK